MSNKNKRKGYYGECRVVKSLVRQGVRAIRVPLSGAAGCFDPTLAGDVVVTLPKGHTLRCEVKYRGKQSGFKLIDNWLQTNDVLFLVAPRHRTLTVMTLETFAKLLEGTLHVQAHV